MNESPAPPEQPWPPTRVWLPAGSAELAAVSPELQNVEGAWWVREDSVRSVSPNADNAAFIYTNTIKLAIEVVKGEKIEGDSADKDPIGIESGRAYNQAIDDAVEALEVLNRANAPTIVLDAVSKKVADQISGQLRWLAAELANDKEK